MSANAGEKKKDVEKKYKLVRKRIWLKKAVKKNIKSEKIIFFIIMAEALKEAEMTIAAKKILERYFKTC